MSPFEFSDYRALLRHAVDHDPKKRSYREVAEASRIQNSYLSQALSGRSDLNFDQAYRLAKSLGFDESVTDYLILLVDYARSADLERKKHLQARIESSRRKRLKTTAFLKPSRNAADGHGLEGYYADPFCPLVHMFLTIPEYQRHPDRLCSRLSLPAQRLEQLIDRLVALGIVERKGNSLEVLIPLLHLEPGTPMAAMHGTSSRAMALDRLQRGADPDGYFVATTFSATQAVRDKIRLELLRLIGELSHEVSRTDANDVFHLNIDLFRV